MKINAFIQTIKEYNYFPNYSGWVFIFLLLIMSAIYDYQDILMKPPQSIHLWRQCDCLSITMNYYQDKNDFLEPSIHNLGWDGKGKTVSDFPLLYYSIAQIWKVTGPHEYIYRLIVLLFFFSGLFAMFKIFESTLKDSILAIAGGLFLFTSPTLVYYANNFLMDIPALSLALIGLYFFFRFSQSASNRYLYLFAFFYALAGLLKISSLISYIAILVLFFLELFRAGLNPARKIFQHPGKQIFVLISVLIIPLIWYIYARNYNAVNNAGIFLIGILPIWDLDLSQIRITLDAIVDHIKWDYFRRETQYVVVFMLISILVFYKRISKLMLLLTVLIASGLLVFVMLFFQAFEHHDYYAINLFILVPVVLLSFLLLIKDKFSTLYYSLFFRLIVFAFLIHNIDFASRRIEGRYDPGEWQNKDYVAHFQAFEEISPYLRSLGINPNDRVISISDYSINSTLYLMNQKGWTNFNTAADSSAIEEKINLGAKYLLIDKKETFEEKSLEPFMENKIGEFRNIDIYAL